MEKKLMKFLNIHFGNCKTEDEKKVIAEFIEKNIYVIVKIALEKGYILESEILNMLP